jgi:general secretion pathway protein B
MSLILDAINKSEQQRPRVEPVPGVAAPHDADAAVEPPAGRRWLWPLITGVLALLVIVLWLDSGTPAPVEKVASPSPVQAAYPTPPVPVEKPPMAVPVQAAHKVAAPPATPTVTPAATPLAESPPAVGGLDVAALYAADPAAGDKVPVAAGSGIAEIEVEEIVLEEAAPPAAEAAPLDVAAIARTAQKALDERVVEPDELVVEHTVPLISKLKQRTKDEIPSIYFSSHHWSTVASERVVTLNGEARRAGARIKPGLVLVEILEDSIVLDYRGTEFRLRSLNSWVNL